MKLNLHARVSSDSPDPMGHFLTAKFGAAFVTQDGADWIVQAAVEANGVREANRTLVAQLRRVERTVHLHAEWVHGGVTERFVDYCPKGIGPVVP